ncbi:MAG: cytochrome c-type biogenesis protein CcmH [Parvularculaceae bacterium]|nr:cytochrome c-type biogenesis protein CcmH [Parvularculaceae bacterium]
MCVASACAFGPALAVNPDEKLADPTLEARALALSREIRCVVCQNQSIDDSNAPLAADMRVIVRERIAAGDGDAEVKNFLVSRYGNFVLLRPPMRADTWFLWFGPALFLIAGAAGFAAYLRRPAIPASQAVPELSADERRRLEELERRGGA